MSSSHRPDHKEDEPIQYVTPPPNSPSYSAFYQNSTTLYSTRGGRSPLAPSPSVCDGSWESPMATPMGTQMENHMEDPGNGKNAVRRHAPNRSNALSSLCISLFIPSECSDRPLREVQPRSWSLRTAVWLYYRYAYTECIHANALYSCVSTSSYATASLNRL
jgi:hypothetical protein